MTYKQKSFKKELIKQAHTAKRYRAYFKDDEEAWRDMLDAHFGVRSSKELNIDQLLALVKWLNFDIPELPVIKDRTKEATARQINAIRKLWSIYARDKSDAALRKFIAKITGNTYLHLDKLAKADATKVIIALKSSLKEL